MTRRDLIDLLSDIHAVAAVTVDEALADLVPDIDEALNDLWAEELSS